MTEVLCTDLCNPEVLAPVLSLWAFSSLCFLLTSPVGREVSLSHVWDGKETHIRMLMSSQLLTTVTSECCLGLVHVMCSQPGPVISNLIT